MVMLPPDISTIHIHNLPVQAAKEQVITAGGHALLQEFCKNMNCTPNAAVQKLDLRVSYGTSDAEKKENSQVTYFIQGWQILASHMASKEQAACQVAPEVQTLCTHLSSSRLKRHSLLSHSFSLQRSYSISMVTLSYLLPFSEPFPALIYPLEMRGTAHGNQSVCESYIYTVA